ncbi:APC family permease [Paenarthrobacter aurescens]|uniref:APC family permease n=1 Tax=Paenarthrobacter aurescens TaxID=43663 RepID=UPI0021BE5421|nr:APC family permease [Paenarthrobacter aurescens]MCT9870419.1 APC family permease [Paenarthrobacter aurescens]
MSNEELPERRNSTLTDPGGPALTRNRLGTLSIASLVVSAVAPVSVMAAATPVIFAVHGPATPASYLIAGLLFAVFSVGYVAMSRHMVNAGGFVAYVARAMGPTAGTATAAVTLLFYLAALVAFYAIAGVVAAGTFGLDINAYWVTFAGIAVVGVLGYLGVSVNVKLLVMLLAVEVAALGVVAVALLIQGGPQGYSLAGFDPAVVIGPGFGVALLLSMTCYSGLEATVVFSEEARDPRRTIRRAVYVSLGFVTGFYAVTSWLITVHVGPDAVQSMAAEDPAGFFFAVTESAMGPGFTRFLEILVATSFLALFIGFQSMISRYVFALARAGALPRRLGATKGGNGNPAAASLAVTGTIAVVMLAFTLAGADPVAVTYSWLVGLGTVGLLAVLSLVSVSILIFFSRHEASGNVWATRVAPAVAALGMVCVLVLAIQNYQFLGAADETARLLLLLIPVAAAAGWAYAAYRRRKGLVLDYATDLGG